MHEYNIIMYCFHNEKIKYIMLNAIREFKKQAFVVILKTFKYFYISWSKSIVCKQPFQNKTTIKVKTDESAPP